MRCKVTSSIKVSNIRCQAPLKFSCGQRVEECHSDMVSEIQRERVLPETILPGLCDFSYSVPHIAEPSAVDESFIRCHGWLGHLGDCEWRTEADHRVHRERNYDGAV